MSDEKLYTKRDHRALEPHYTRHVSAMTGEGLHAKSDIAAELAFRDREIDRLRAVLSAPDDAEPKTVAFKLGDIVEKVRGSEWVGTVCGTYSTDLTPEGYCVESLAHAGSVQIYPATALKLLVPDTSEEDEQ